MVQYSKKIAGLFAELDHFIDTVIKPLEAQDDNIRFFDHRREWPAQTLKAEAYTPRMGSFVR